MVDLGPLYYRPRQGDIGLCDIKGVTGTAVMIGQFLNGDGWHRHTEHAFVFVGNGQIIEAMPGGALLSHLGKYDADKILWLKCPLEYGSSVAVHARQFGPQRDADGKLIKRGVPYSWLDYAALGAHRLRIPAPHLRKFLSSRDSMICSQLADAAAQRGGWKIFDDGRWSGYVTPRMLAGVALKQAKAVHRA